MTTSKHQNKGTSQELDHWSKLRARCSCTIRMVNIQYILATCAAICSEGTSVANISAILFRQTTHVTCGHASYKPHSHGHPSCGPRSYGPPSYGPPSYGPPSYEPSSCGPPSYMSFTHMGLPSSYEPPSYRSSSHEPPSCGPPSYRPPSYEPLSCGPPSCGSSSCGLLYYYRCQSER